MSIAAMNWALAQRLESQGQQILLYVIADSCDPAGVTRHCDPDYMADRARCSRATMFRRLGELEAIGALSRTKFFSEYGAPGYEIRLNLAARFDHPIKRRRSDDEGDGGDEGDGHAPGPGGGGAADATADGVKSQLETHPKSQLETGAVSPVRLPQSHSCDSICPTLSKDSPPTPPPGGLRSKMEVEQGEKRDALWELFKARYPGIGRMDQQAARAELDKLEPDDAEWAISVIEPYDAECRKAKVLAKNATVWLRKGMFRNFPRQKLEAAKPQQAEVWVRENSDEDRAVRFVRSLSSAISPFVRTTAEGRGYFLREAVGADMLAMLTFSSQSQSQWLEVERGSHQFGAWQTRMVEWTGKPLPLTKPRPAAGQPADPGAPDVIRVPCPWPPKKDGTLYTPTHAPPAVPELTDDDRDALANERFT